MLGIALFAQVLSVYLANVPLFLITHLHRSAGMSLPGAGLLAAMPLIGATLTLVAWGAVADRLGERRTLTLGLALQSAAALASLLDNSRLWMAATWFVMGIGSASLNSASGRLIVGWFDEDRRGTAMGIRQTAQPLGVGLAAFFAPVLAAREGMHAAIALPAVACGVAVLVAATTLVDPARPERRAETSDNPYRGSRTLVRIHAASALLVIPQFTVWSFMVVWLVDARGWPIASAGLLAAAVQLAGAGGRIGSGWWSDRLGSRMRPFRLIAVAALLVMLSLGAAEPTFFAVALLIVAAVITVSDNGLAFTAVAEIGGPFWAGRAMGIQNTGQALTASLVPPLVGALIAAHGYGAAFALVAVAPLVAIPLIPIRAEAARRAHLLATAGEHSGS
jgi:MFS family permease